VKLLLFLSQFRKSSFKKFGNSLGYFTAIFDRQGIVHYDFIPEGKTLNKESHVDVFRRLRDAVREKRPEN
jgi:hypothetical protein